MKSNKTVRKKRVKMVSAKDSLDFFFILRGREKMRDDLDNAGFYTCRSCMMQVDSRSKNGRLLKKIVHDYAKEEVSQ